MNTDQRSEASAPPPELPVLAEDRIDEMEDALFADIARERSARRAGRSRGWLIAGAAAAVIVVAAVIAPSVGTLVGGAATYESADAPAPQVQPDRGAAGVEAGEVSESTSLSDLDATKQADAAGGRDIITTASASVEVEDIGRAAAAIADAAESRDGYVESMSIGRSGQVLPVEPGVVYDSTMPSPYPSEGGWVTVRVPAEALQSLLDQLSGVGEVTASTVNRQDVTEATLDLEARVDAAQASVDRLTQLMAQAGNLTDLIAAESALAERQATLESYQQQLKYYDDQVALSTLTVTLTEPAEAVSADPAGFGDGIAAGWNGLVATLNGIVLALGFLIPWIGVLVVAGLIAWAIVALVRRRRSRRTVAASAGTPAEPAESGRSAAEHGTPE
ncbi:DUF4349 domain-containing protein [Microbacterium sp. zg.B48]|uniref:DUF4349 domain-containing protein n=1 Tax=Microbacterium sp. zg.B48 TaxID=2969408 RepID=UPI00214ACEAE|nr:DUF4349 domain-containing protein [Microbacterium sp. zg.B48]MCR2763636.1 DUF4349 domain-containing protein [Microbacterium sp. zg.B48]